jgi:hypothetical protein
MRFPTFQVPTPVIAHLLRGAGAVAALGAALQVTGYFPGLPTEQASKPIIALLGLGAAFVAAFVKPPSTASGAQLQRIRPKLVEALVAYWPEPELTDSVPDLPLITPEMRDKSEIVMPPQVLPLRSSWMDRDHKLRPGTTIAAAYREALGALLILGAPGAGKTTQMRELARQLADVAAHTPQAPVPVIFQLSTWANARGTLEEWLVDELHTMFQLERELGKQLVGLEEIVPFLDGLDEVRAELRGACVSAINEFRRKHGQADLVVCSRVDEYVELGVSLTLNRAIELERLAPEWVDSYLNDLGPQFAPLRRALEGDSDLRDLVRTPLRLRVFTIAYGGESSSSLPPVESPIISAAGVFEVYVDRMLGRRLLDRVQLREPRDPALQYGWSNERVVRWLGWLAWTIREHDQTNFLLEHIQPSWLTPSQLRRYRVGFQIIGAVVTLALFLIVVAPVARFGGFSTWPDGPWSFALLAELAVCLILIFVVAPRSVVKRATGEIDARDALTWSWEKGRQALLGGALGAIIAFGSLVVIGLIVQVVLGLNPFDADLVPVFVFFVVMGLPPLVLFSGFSRSEMQLRMSPNQGILQSARRGLVLGLAAFIFVEVGSALFIAIESRTDELSQLDDNLISALTLSVPAGLAVAAYLGGFAWLQHHFARVILSRDSCMPFELTEFLEFAVNRVLMFRVGGGYLFTHRLLLDHFAAEWIRGQGADQSGARDARYEHEEPRGHERHRS